ncbi:hypothetical protein PCE1_003251 [Barthelona sp. PCE]
MDSDSCISAVCYAKYLKQKNPDWNVVAGGCNPPNRQSQWILDTFALPAPKLYLDIYPRVKEICAEGPITIETTTPVSRALELFHLYGFRILPVLRPRDKVCVGCVFIEDILTLFLSPHQETELRKVVTTPHAIKNTLKTEVINKAENYNRLDVYYVFTGAYSPEIIQERLDTIPKEELANVIMIVGDLDDVHEYAIKLGIGVLVLTADTPLTPEIFDLAAESNTTVLRSSYGGTASIILSRQSTPCGVLIRKRIEDVNGPVHNSYELISSDDETDESDPLLDCPVDETFLVHEDTKISEVKVRFLNEENSTFNGCAVINSQGSCVGVLTKSDLFKQSPYKVHLVDHNEMSQAVPGIETAEVYEIIDHHKLNTLQTTRPIFIKTAVVGSTCSMIAQKFLANPIIKLHPAVAGALLCGLLSDTLILRSPTCTPFDRDLATTLSRISGYSYFELGQEMFRAGSAIGEITNMEELITTDFKTYDALSLSGQIKYGVSQIEVSSFSDATTIIDTRLPSGAKRVRSQQNLDLLCVIITDIMIASSIMLVVGAPNMRHLIGYQMHNLYKNYFNMPGVLSRKLQVVPMLEGAIPNLEFDE